MEVIKKQVSRKEYVITLLFSDEDLAELRETDMLQFNIEVFGKQILEVKDNETLPSETV